jgi:hypothetical protein
MNSWYGVEWTRTTPFNQVDFMDLIIFIVDGTVHITLFKKAMNLFLYIPLHTSHSHPVLCIHRLCSSADNAATKINPLFRRAEENATSYLTHSADKHQVLEQNRKQEVSLASRSFSICSAVSFRGSSISQHSEDYWQDYVSHLPDDTPLAQMKNMDGAE